MIIICTYAVHEMKPHGNNLTICRIKTRKPLTHIHFLYGCRLCSIRNPSSIILMSSYVVLHILLKSHMTGFGYNRQMSMFVVSVCCLSILSILSMVRIVCVRRYSSICVVLSYSLCISHTNNVSPKINPSECISLCLSLVACIDTIYIHFTRQRRIVLCNRWFILYDEHQQFNVW